MTLFYVWIRSFADENKGKIIFIYLLVIFFHHRIVVLRSNFTSNTGSQATTHRARYSVKLRLHVSDGADVNMDVKDAVDVVRELVCALLRFGLSEKGNRGWFALQSFKQNKSLI